MIKDIVTNLQIIQSPWSGVTMFTVRSPLHPPLQKLLPLMSKAFELILRYLGQRIHRSGKNVLNDLSMTLTEGHGWVIDSIDWHGMKNMLVMHSWPWYCLAWPWWSGQICQMVIAVTLDVSVPLLELAPDSILKSINDIWSFVKELTCEGSSWWRWLSVVRHHSLCRTSPVLKHERHKGYSSDEMC